MKKKIRTAVIGVGSMGINHARVYSEISDLRAISDLNQNLGKQIADKFKIPYYKDYIDLLKTEKIEAVSIVVPTSFHKKVALDCLKFKVPVLIEKPLASSVSDANIIIEAFKKQNILLTVGHIEQFNPAVVKLKELINAKTLGKIVSIVIKRVGLYPPRINDVDVVTDLAVHDLDIACSLINQLPKRIYASGGYGLGNKKIDYADIFLDFNKISCCIQVNWMTPIKIRQISVTGTLGYAELDYISQELAIYKTNPKDYNKPIKKFLKINHREPLMVELENFLSSVYTKQKPIVTGEQGLEALRLAKLVSKSINKNKLIELN